jgi:hypothetical protein
MMTLIRNHRGRASERQTLLPFSLCLLPCSPRRGTASVLAMLYLMLFSSLAIGFYAATNVSVQVSHNERRGTLASVAAESGMEFVRYQLAQVIIPHGTPQSQLFDRVYEQLCTNLNSTPNLAGKTITNTNGVISLPTTGYINLDSGGNRFRATITDLGQKIRVKVTGLGPDGSIARAIQLDYDLAERASAIFDYGVASKGKIYTAGSSRIRGATDPTKGSVLSTCMSDPTPVVIRGKEVSGDISVVNPAANIVIDGASVGGTTSMAEILAKHVHKGVQEPEFPTVDTAAFAAYATNVYVPGQNTYTNVRIPPNTNPTIAANTQIKGVLYIEAPNYVTFRGGVDIQGVIVVPNGVSEDLARNVLDFSGNFTSSGVQTLPESFGNLRQLTGSFILAPGFHTKFTGNFSTVNGSIISSKVSMTGNAGGTIMGTVINLANQQMDVTGSAEIVIASTGTSNYPAGVFFSSNYAPLPDTFEEVQP